MVVYEVLSGQKPFYTYRIDAVVAGVIKGERPVRPQGVEGRLFTDGVWNILGRCWEHNPDDHPVVEDVLDCLEEVSRSWNSS